MSKVSKVSKGVKIQSKTLKQVTPSKSLPQGKETSSRENEKCYSCEEIVKTGTSPFSFLWTLKRNIEPDLPSDILSDKMLLNAENIKRAEVYFLEYCKLNCEKFMNAPEKTLRKILHFSSLEEEEKFTKLAREEFRKPRITAEDLSTADSNRTNSESTLPIIAARTDVKFRSKDNYNDIAPLAESLRALTDLQNQSFTTDKSEADTDTQLTTTITLITEKSNTEILNTTPQMEATTEKVKVIPTISEFIPMTTTESEDSTDYTEKTEPEDDSDYDEIENLIEELEKIFFNINSELNDTLSLINDFVSCVIDVIMTDIEQSMDLPFSVFLREKCGNSSVPKFFLALTNFFTEDYLEHLSDWNMQDELDGKGIFKILGDFSLRSGLARNGRTWKGHSRASGRRKSSRISEVGGDSTSADSVRTLTDYLQWRASRSKNSNENQ